MSEFLAQGGYAAYVWTAYGVSFAALALTVALTLRGYRKARRAIEGLDRHLQASETNP